MKRYKLIPFMAFALIVACGKKETAAVQDDAITIKTAKIITEQYARPIISSGIITSDVEANLSFKVGGIIEKLYVQEGDRVAKGQLIATLNTTEIAAQLQQSKNDYEKAQRNYKRMENLYKDNAATTEEFENSNTALSTALQAYQIAKFNKQHAAIYANQSGSVIKKLMNEGEIANAGTAVYTINSTDNNDWVIRLGLSDKDWVKLKKGDKATISADAYGEKEFEAVVSEIGVGANPETGTFSVKLKINPQGAKFANGLAAKVSIHPSDKELLRFIPSAAIVEANENSGTVYSLEADGKTIKQHKIKIAFTENDRVAVSSGLENTATVITDGSAYLLPDSKIKLSGTK